MSIAQVNEILKIIIDMDEGLHREMMMLIFTQRNKKQLKEMKKSVE
jgi:hypothetical protein